MTTLEITLASISIYLWIAGGAFFAGEMEDEGRLHSVSGRVIVIIVWPFTIPLAMCSIGWYRIKRLIRK